MTHDKNEETHEKQQDRRMDGKLQIVGYDFARKADGEER